MKDALTCDFCNKDLTNCKTVVCVEDVNNEGCSRIYCGNKDYAVEEAYFCSIDCLLNNIRTSLTKVDEENYHRDLPTFGNEGRR